MANHPPLAERARPNSIDQILGQEKLVGPGGVLRTIYESGAIPSLILWGPPGVGKTTIARLLSSKSNLQLFSISAVHAGVKEVRGLIETAKKLGRAVVFIDEIHRFNKSQQDSLLGAVEAGHVILIGATTENPSFEVNRALLSRCQVLVLESLSAKDLELLLQRVIKEDELLGKTVFQIESTQVLFRQSGGDARRLLNLIELCYHQKEGDKVVISDSVLSNLLSKNPIAYDRAGEMHYDIISAFIKSIRGSDPNAGLYWLARMVEGGEDPKFIARRLLILASEDIGNANPTALVLANNCFQAVNVLGYPEARIVLAQTVIYLASSPKSNASYEAIEKAIAAVKKTGDLPVPLELRNAPTKLMKELNYGKEYKYAHNYDGNFVKTQFLPENLEAIEFLELGSNHREKELKKWLKQKWGEQYDF